MQVEMEELIEGICSTYKDFSQKQADTASLLDCVAAEELQRASAKMDPLPELEEGPDEVGLLLQPSILFQLCVIEPVIKT